MLKKFLPTFAALTFFVILAGCKTENEPIVATIGHNPVTVAEFKFYLYSTQKEYEKKGGEDIWETLFDDMTAEEKAKEVTINSIASVKITIAQKNNYKISLTEEDTQKALKDAENFINNTDAAIIEKIGATKEDIITIMEENILYSKIYNEITKSFVLSENDFFRYYQNESKKHMDYELQYILLNNEETAREVHSKIEKGADFTSLVQQYSTDESVAFNNGYINFIPGHRDESFEDWVYSHSEGDISPVIESSKGFYIIKLISKTSQDEDILKDYLRNQYIAESKREIFMQEFNKWQADTPIEKKDDIWNAIHIIQPY